nr:hypothetical protein [Actinospica acidiphila]
MRVEEVDSADGVDHVVRFRLAQVIDRVRVEQAQTRHVGVVGPRPLDLAGGGVNAVDPCAVGAGQMRGVPPRTAAQVEDPQTRQVAQDLVPGTVHAGPQVTRSRSGKGVPRVP